MRTITYQFFLTNQVRQNGLQRIFTYKIADLMGSNKNSAKPHEIAIEDESYSLDLSGGAFKSDVVRYFLCALTLSFSHSFFYIHSLNISFFQVFNLLPLPVLINTYSISSYTPCTFVAFWFIYSNIFRQKPVISLSLLDGFFETTILRY